MAAALRAALPGKRIDTPALLCGAVAPDVVICLLFAALFLRGVVIGGESPGAVVEGFSALYFESPLVIAAHNLLHSPTSLALALIAAFTLRNAYPNAVRRLRFFLYGCLTHAVVDTLTHYDDGPLLLWPFDWAWRFHSPISHWDPLHWGPYVMSVELVLNVVIVTWLLSRLCRRAIAYSLPFANLPHR